MIKKLLIDCTHINGYTGISNYAIRIVNGWNTLSGIPFAILLWKGQEDFLYPQLDFEPETILLNPAHPYRSKNKMIRLFQDFPFTSILEEHGIEQVMTTCLTMNSMVFPAKYNQCAVIHDLQTLKLDKERFSPAQYLYNRLFTKALYRKIPRLITISGYVHDELKTFCGKESQVIYNSVPFDDSQSEVYARPIEEPYILDVNSFTPYKNAEVLVRAFAFIREKIPHKLYLKGINDRTPYCDHLRRVAEECGVSDRLIIDGKGRSEEEMSALYQNASLVVSPSLMEGFGFAPIEAAIIGVPVLISDIPTLREVTCGKIPTFDPENPGKLSEKMLSILQKSPSHQELSQTSSYFKDKYSQERQIKEIERYIGS